MYNRGSPDTCLPDVETDRVLPKLKETALTAEQQLVISETHVAQSFLQLPCSSHMYFHAQLETSAMLPFFTSWLTGGPSSWDMFQDNLDIEAFAGDF